MMAALGMADTCSTDTAVRLSLHKCKKMDQSFLLTNTLSSTWLKEINGLKQIQNWLWEISPTLQRASPNPLIFNESNQMHILNQTFPIYLFYTGQEAEVCSQKNALTKSFPRLKNK